MRGKDFFAIIFDVGVGYAPMPYVVDEFLIEELIDAKGKHHVSVLNPHKDYTFERVTLT